jgi:hypothetical protein
LSRQTLKKTIKTDDIDVPNKLIIYKAVIIYGGGSALKRKGLGKQNSECVKGWISGEQNNSRVG